jgi:hypothetical protein
MDGKIAVMFLGASINALTVFVFCGFWIHHYIYLETVEAQIDTTQEAARAYDEKEVRSLPQRGSLLKEETEANARLNQVNRAETVTLVVQDIHEITKVPVGVVRGQRLSDCGI